MDKLQLLLVPPHTTDPELEIGKRSSSGKKWGGGGVVPHSAVKWHLNRRVWNVTKGVWGRTQPPRPSMLSDIKNHHWQHIFINRPLDWLQPLPSPPTRKKKRKVSVSYGGGGGGVVGEGSLQWPRRTQRLNSAEADTQSGWAAELWLRAPSLFHLFNSFLLRAGVPVSWHTFCRSHAHAALTPVTFPWKQHDYGKTSTFCYSFFSFFQFTYSTKWATDHKSEEKLFQEK